MEGPPRRGALGPRIIGAFKLVTAVLLVAAGFGIFHLVNKDVGEIFQRIVTLLRLDPENSIIHRAIRYVSGVDPKHLKALGVGTFVYAALHLVEGVGLVLGYRWASYLTIVITGSLIPLELYEVARKLSAVRIAVLAVNLAIVIYLAVKVRQESKATAETPAKANGVGRPGG